MVILSILASIIFAFFPALLWLAFFLREDDHQEPAGLVIKTFLYGAIMSIPALLIQLFFEKSIGGFPSALIITMFLYAVIEEVFKFWGAYSSVRRRPDFDEPIDGMIYLIIAGLGFATVENIFVLSTFFGAAGFHELAGAGQALLLRLIGATLLHTLASALIGYYWALGIVEKRERRYLFIGLVVASIVHGIFNYLVYLMQNTNLLVPSLFLVGVTFFVLNDFEKLRHIDEGGNVV